jgi:hypothetical protein
MWKAQSKIHTQWYTNENFPSMIKKKVKMPTLTTSIQHSIRCPTRAIEQEKVKGSKWERKQQNYLFADDKILCVQNSKTFTKNLLK